jgi:uncharacterized LabA/DUF88 family protein
LKVAVLIDGGHVRALANQANKKYDPGYIEKIALASCLQGETLLRVLYYDCAPFVGKKALPVSGLEFEFNGSDQWLKDLARKDLFAVRLGVLKFRGFKPKAIPVKGSGLTDADFKPDFEQKGVDMRIGLDIANFAANKSVDRIILISGDTDCIPAMKHARISGVQVAVVKFDGTRLSQELEWHSDFVRSVSWP